MADKATIKMVAIPRGERDLLVNPVLVSGMYPYPLAPERKSVLNLFGREYKVPMQIDDLCKLLGIEVVSRGVRYVKPGKLDQKEQSPNDAPTPRAKPA